MKVWLMCSEAPYRLPVAAADSAVELAKITGGSATSIRTIASMARRGKFPNGAKYECVEIGEVNEHHD